MTPKIRFQAPEPGEHGEAWVGTQSGDWEGGRYEMTMWVVAEPGGPRVSKVSVTYEPRRRTAKKGETPTIPWQPGISHPQAEITPSLLRQLPFHPVRTAILKRISAHSPTELRRPPQDRQRPGRGGRDDIFYARWASSYVAALNRGSRSPVKDLTGTTGLSTSQIRTILNEATTRGLLIRGEPGKAGGRLTAEAIELLGAEQAWP